MNRRYGSFLAWLLAISVTSQAGPTMNSEKNKAEASPHEGYSLPALKTTFITQLSSSENKSLHLTKMASGILSTKELSPLSKQLRKKPHPNSNELQKLTEDFFNQVESTDSPKWDALALHLGLAPPIPHSEPEYPRHKRVEEFLAQLKKDSHKEFERYDEGEGCAYLKTASRVSGSLTGGSITHTHQPCASIRADIAEGKIQWDECITFRGHKKPDPIASDMEAVLELLEDRLKAMKQDGPNWEFIQTFPVFNISISIKESYLPKRQLQVSKQPE